MSFLAAMNSDADVAEGFQYPIRPSQPDCAFYLRTGGCKFGSYCRFNHPREKKADQDKDQISTEELQIVKEKDKGISKALDQCKFHLMPGGCRFGETCRYIHSNEKIETVPVELNALGLPIRKGQKLCSYYVRTGVCKYSSTCKFHHPEPSGVAGLHVSRNQSASTLQSTRWPSRLPVTSQALMTSSNGSGSNLDILLPCLPAMSLEWLNLYTDQIKCQDNNAPSVSKRTNNSSTVEQNGIFKLADISIQQKEAIDNCKESGESHSLNGIKYEGFKLALACLPNHSKDHLSDSETCLLSPIGLPQRPLLVSSCIRFLPFVMPADNCFISPIPTAEKLVALWPLESIACSLYRPLQSGSAACGQNPLLAAVSGRQRSVPLELHEWKELEVKETNDIDQNKLLK